MENLNKKRKPRTLYLMRGTGFNSGYCYVTTNPKRVVKNYRGGYLNWDGTLAPRTVVATEPRAQLASFCVDGLTRAGVKIPAPGKTARLTVFLRPVANPRPRK